ncbi:MAG: hypothetical protein ACP5RH_11045 [Leptodesmis sp.]|uniref:hypothetical protein n=1 Tax=Leptodesmis sp. TaxID=3100501 RepID=UPI003D102628
MQGITDTVHSIEAEFKRLGVSTDHHPYSGLTAEAVSGVVVKVYDDYASGFYASLPLKERLRSLAAPISFDEMWQEIKPFETGFPDQN